MNKKRYRKPILHYVLYRNTIDNKDYAIQGKYKKNLDKYFELYGKLKNAPPDIMVPGFLVIYNNKNDMINVDSWISVILRVKDLEPKWAYILS
jgi:hypothetical protein